LNPQKNLKDIPGSVDWKFVFTVTLLSPVR
jgi:hypothetical protein